MSVTQLLLLYLLLAALSLSTCLDEGTLGPTARPLTKGSVSPVSNVRADPRAHCHVTRVPVALAAGQAAKDTIFGQLCLPPRTDHQRVPTVHLVIHSATYSHLYWGWPYQPETHSYIKHLVAAGYAVFAFDRIGIGRSSHPPGASVTLDVNAFVVHQLVRALRSGAIGKTAFQRVVLVGHSLGSIISLAEAGTYHDVDGVVLTGISHFSPSGASLLPYFARDNQDPRFVGRHLDDDYLTTPPGSREASFYSAPLTDPDPRLMALDEATKETVTTAELRTMGPVLTSGASFAIRVPVLMVAGQFDPEVCGGAPICASLEASAAAFAVAEAPFFAPDACLATVVIQDAGPYLNLEPTAPVTYAVIRAWSDAHVGVYQAAPPCGPGRMRGGRSPNIRSASFSRAQPGMHALLPCSVGRASLRTRIHPAYRESPGALGACVPRDDVAAPKCLSASPSRGSAGRSSPAASELPRSVMTAIVASLFAKESRK